MTNSPAAVLNVGVQEPQVLSLPPSRVYNDAADDALEISAIGGIEYDPWQEFSLRCLLWETADRKWAAFECGLLLARQNGKGEVLMGRELYGLFVARDPLIVHSAHEFKTAEEAFLRIRDVIKNSDELSRKVKAMPESHGDEAIILHSLPTIITGAGSRAVRRERSAPRLRFFARTKSGGRGFTADTIVWDEGFNIPEAMVAAQLPMLSAVTNPQLILASSAVDKTKHDHGQVLTKVRNRALRGNDPSLAWVEWRADEQRYRQLVAARDRRGIREFAGDTSQWLAANPGMGYRLSIEHTTKERKTMSARTFLVERLNIGDWPTVEEDEGVIDMNRWDAIADPESRPVGAIALAIDVSPERDWATIASAGRRADGRLHVKIVDHREFAVTWVVDRIVDLIARYKVVAVTLDPAGQAGALIEPLHEAGVKDRTDKPWPRGHLVVTTARQMAQACGAFLNDVDPKNDALRHCGQDNLDDALRDATTRPLADAWAWSRKDSTGEITPVVAATLAAYGFRAFGSKAGIQPLGGYV